MSTPPTSAAKRQKIVLVGLCVIIGVVAVLLAFSPWFNESAEGAAEPSPTSSASPSGDASTPNTGPTLSAGGSFPTATATQPAAQPQIGDGTPTPRSRPAEQFKRDAEDAGLEFLKIYLNANGAENDHPLHFTEKLEPYATAALIEKIRAPYEGVTPEWNWVGEIMHEKAWNVSVEGFCGLGPMQGPPPAFDEEEGGNMPCSFRQVVRGADGKEANSKPENIQPDQLGAQSLKMVREDGRWKVAELDSFLP